MCRQQDTLGTDEGSRPEVGGDSVARIPLRRCCANTPVDKSRKKRKLPPRRRVWRITEQAPQGEWVDRDAPVPSRPASLSPEESSSGWMLSSFDLLKGAEVSEDHDTVPDELFDELFGPQDKKPEPPRE